jgi:hypothetical protein
MATPLRFGGVGVGVVGPPLSIGIVGPGIEAGPGPGGVGEGMGGVAAGPPIVGSLGTAGASGDIDGKASLAGWLSACSVLFDVLPPSKEVLNELSGTEASVLSPAFTGALLGVLSDAAGESEVLPPIGTSTPPEGATASVD